MLIAARDGSFRHPGFVRFGGNRRECESSIHEAHSTLMEFLWLAYIFYIRITLLAATMLLFFFLVPLEHVHKFCSRFKKIVYIVPPTSMEKTKRTHEYNLLKI